MISAGGTGSPPARGRVMSVNEAPPNYTKVRLECRGNHPPILLCVRVERGVPARLRCQPGGSVSVGGGSPTCPGCSDLLQNGAKLQRVVNDTTRRGWDDHMKAGAVIIRCG